MPWNFPLLMASWKVAPALAAGNTAILKPASYSPLTAIRLGELALEAGIPAGVLNVVTGPGGTAGASIAAHPGIGKVAFTGETTTGQEIMRLAAGQREEDLPRARRQEPQHRLRRRGPREVRPRVAVLRLRQHRPGLLRAQPDPRRALASTSEVVELFAAATRKVKVGDPADEATEVGTLVSFKQRDRVQDYIEIGLGEGATLVVGGDAPDDPALADGAYLMPTVFDGVVERHAHRPRGDLRAGRVDHPVRHRGGGAPPRQRHAVRPVRLDLEPRHRQGAARGEGAPGRASSASTRTARSTPRRRSAATRCRASGASSGCRALDLYTETKNVFIDLS